MREMCLHLAGQKDKTLLKIALALSAFIIDQVSKIWALKNCPSGISVPLIPRFLYLTLTENKGIAFGALSAFNSLFLSLLSLTIVILLVYFWREHSPYLYLIVGGALGNILDRIRLGYVVDFIHIRFWPVFNIADICILLGVILTLISTLRKKGGKEDVSDNI
ncbi:signal peptidase II [bacterium]|nr:signal peptidase II [bacterium]